MRSISCEGLERVTEPKECFGLGKPYFEMNQKIPLGPIQSKLTLNVL